MSNLKTLIPQKAAWAHLPTIAIRVPQIFQSEILVYARALDSGAAPQTSQALESLNLAQLLELEKTLPALIKAAREATCDRRLETAILRLANLCDGASAKDGQGFTGADAGYGHYLARQVQEGTLSPKNAKQGLAMLQKYANTQLSDIELPDWDAIAHQYSAPNLPPELPEHRIVMLGDKISVYAPYDSTGQFQAKAKAIKGYNFESSDKSWRYPLDRLSEVLLAFPDYEKINPELFEGALAYQAMQAAQLEAEKAAQSTAKAQYLVDLIEKSNLDAPLANGWELFPHQKEAAQWLLAHSKGGAMKGGILADHMGLGKTLSALAAAKGMREIHKVPIFVVCPASLKDNWLLEAAKVGVPIEVFSWAKLPQPLEAQKYVLIADESHYAQNAKSKRTLELLDLAQSPNCLAAWLLTGTPIKNGRPINLMPLLMAIAHPLVADTWEYQRRYCNAHKRSIGSKLVWDNSGASHLDELQRKTTDAILRRTKKDCLNLPDKIRSIVPVELDPKIQKAYDARIAALIEDYQTRAAAGLVDINAEALATLNILRKTGSEFKVSAAIALATEILEQGEQIVIFTEYLESAHALHNALGGELLTGEVPTDQRQAIVERFQGGESKVFIGTIRAGGVGLTLTKASNVLMVDRPWTPGDAEQAEDRCHRIGQNSTVTAFWLQLGAIDQSIDFLIEQKQERIELVLKGKRKTLRGIKSIGDLAKQLLEAF
jgi:SNF2 family DNA or RNA helicase